MKVAADKRYTSRFDALLLAAILALTGIGLYAQQTATRNVERPFEPSFFFISSSYGLGLR